jgi:RNA polymerase sigma-70 factor (ECF subfamily)
LKTELENIKSQLEALHSESQMWAMGCCGWDQQEALEVIQTTYLKIMEGKARFEGRSSLRPGYLQSFAAQLKSDDADSGSTL